MRIAFFGSGAFGLPTLLALAQRHEIVGVVTQPDKPAGRGGKLTPTPIGEWADLHLPGAVLLKPADVNVSPAGEAVRAWSADAFVVIAFGQKLSPGVLMDARGSDRFAINLHASLLPRWRGAAPINAAILAGDRETGNSVITLAQRMDAGLILAQSRRPIESSITAGELHDLLAEDGSSLVLGVLDGRESGALESRAQDAALVTKATKLSKSDGHLDFSLSAEECRRRVHGLTPWPGAAAAFRGDLVKLLRVDVVVGDCAPGAEAGTVLDSHGIIACGGGSRLKLLEVQPAGKRGMTWAEFANGHRIVMGERLTPPPC